MARFLGGPLRLNERAADDIFRGWISPSPYEPLDNVEKNFKFFRVKRTTWWQQKWVKPLGISVEQIGDFCNPVQNFYWVIQSYPNSVDLSKYLIQDVLSPKKNPLIKHFTVMNAVWISISDPVNFFRNPLRSGSGSELQNPVGSWSGNWIMFNTCLTLLCRCCIFKQICFSHMCWALRQAWQAEMSTAEMSIVLDLDRTGSGL